MRMVRALIVAATFLASVPLQAATIDFDALGLPPGSQFTGVTAEDGFDLSFINLRIAQSGANIEIQNSPTTGSLTITRPGGLKFKFQSIDWRSTSGLGASIVLYAYVGGVAIANTTPGSGGPFFSFSRGQNLPYFTFTTSDGSNCSGTCLAGVEMDRLVITGWPGETNRPGAFDNIVLVPVTPNAPPTANAGADQSIHAGNTVNLNGGGSFDDNTATAALGYAWSFVSRPAGSSATISGANTAAPSFYADRAGTYLVQLIVTDGAGLTSAADQVVVSSLNQAPTAAAGADQLVVVFDTVQLSGSGSTDPDGDAMTFSWAITSAPAGSTAVLSGANTATPNFQPDKAGSYSVTLTASDFLGAGTPDTVEVTAISASAYAEQKIMCGANLITGLAPNQVTTKGNQTALGNFLGQAAKAIQKGQTATAIHKLMEAIERTDGCEVNPGPSPDGNGPGRDWVTDCNVQPPILACLREALRVLTP